MILFEMALGSRIDARNFWGGGGVGTGGRFSSLTGFRPGIRCRKNRSRRVSRVNGFISGLVSTAILAKPKWSLRRIRNR